MGNEEVIKQLKEILDDKFHFEKWNTTSVSHIIIALTGHNGSEGKKLSIKIFENFLSWYEMNKQDKYIPFYGTECMYSKQCCRILLNIVKDSIGMSKEEIGQLFNNEINKDKINFKSCNYLKCLYQYKKPIIITIIGGMLLHQIFM